MKRNHIFFIAFLFVGLIFTSCSDDDNNNEETFYSGDAAKQAAKGTWIVKSIKINSDNPATDITPNYLFDTFLYNLKSMKISLDEKSIQLTTDPKSSDFEALDIKEQYSFIGDNQILVKTSLGLQLPFEFTVSNKRQFFSQQFTKTTLVFLIQMIGDSINNAELEAAVKQIVQALPDDYSGKLTVEMSK